jgi:DNA repair photolyase
MKKTFKGKAIYNPSGKAGEYSYWACNFYKGCSNGCTYCYLKKGVLAHAMGGDKPELKACFKNEAQALEVFEKELLQNIDELRKHGLFFTFTSDPMLPETIYLTLRAVLACLSRDVPVKILTKNAAFLDYNIFRAAELANLITKTKQKIAFGFTLTGHDELEPGACTNAERIKAMRKLHEAGFKTFASIEPIIDLKSSFEMIRETNCCCDLYKIGLLAGKKYDRNELQLFVEGVINQVEFFGAKVYFKDSLLKKAEIERSELYGNCVTRDYNLFKTNTK